MKQRIKHLLLVLLVGTYFVGTAQKPTDAKLPTDSKVKIGKLANGLTYYIRKNVEPKNRAELRLVVNAGSTLETEKQRGLAHFVEHMCFNGTKNFKKQELVDFLEKSGVNFGADLNAYTSFDETVYELQVPTDSPMVYKKAMQVLEDWAHQVSFDPIEIDKERGVVTEEWRLGRGADARLRDKYFPIILNGSQYAKRLPIGTKESINGAPYSELTGFYKDWYRPNLQAVIVVGDIDVAETEKMIQSHFGKLTNPASPKPRTKFSIPSFTDTRISILTDPEQAYNVLQMFYMIPAVKEATTEGEYRQGMVRELFNQMMSSRLDELSQKPEAPFLFASSSYGEFLGDKDAFTLLAVPKTAKEMDAAFNAILTENERVKQYGFVQSELDRAVKNVMSRMENSFKEKDKTKSVQILQEYVRNFLKGEAIPGIEKEFEMYQRYLPSIALQEVNALINQWLTVTGKTVLVLAPEKEKANLMTEAGIKAILAKPIAKLNPYQDKVASGPLLPKAPIAGKIISENKYDSIGTRVWTLSNGSKVIVKPTTFKNDEIQFSAISWGGSSLYSDTDFINASNAAVVASYGGMGNIDYQSMQKMFAGKNFGINPSISEYLQGFTGSSSPKDLATALEVLHGYFVAPRKDAQIFQFILQQYKVQLTNKNNDPPSVFSDTVGYVMGNYNSRRKPLTVEMLDQLNLDRSFEIFKERFSNAGQFVFTFVGNVNIDSLKALTETYIASLPATGVSEMYKDYGAAYPTGNISKTVKMGKEAKASVQLFYTGTLNSIGEFDELQLDQLTKAMGIKLRETLREDAGGVYGVGISGGINKEPKKSYSINVRFGCAPENVEKLIALVEEEIKQTKLNGVAQINIDKVKAEQTRTLENDVKENSYWRYKLEQAIFRGTDPNKILLAPAKINLIDVATTKALANKYFNDANKAKFVLLPE